MTSQKCKIPRGKAERAELAATPTLAAAVREPETDSLSNRGRKRALKRIRRLSKDLPAGWKFNRDEANSR